MTGRRRPWASWEDRILLDSLRTFQTYRQIGARIGRTPGACSHRMFRLRHREERLPLPGGDG